MSSSHSNIYNQGLESWWDPQAKLSALNRLNPGRFSYFDKKLPEWKGKRVLDVGCGGGFTSEFLAKREAIVSGIDPFEKVIEVAKAHAKISHLDIDYKVAAAETIPYPDGTFDSIICVDVLEHLTDLEKAIMEMHRVLKKDGYLFIDTINKTLSSRIVMIWLLENVIGLIPRGAHDWNMFIRPKYLTELLTKNGFRDIEVRGLAFRGIDQNNNFKFAFSKNMQTMYIGSARN